MGHLELYSAMGLACLTYMSLYILIYNSDGLQPTSDGLYLYMLYITNKFAGMQKETSHTNRIHFPFY